MGFDRKILKFTAKGYKEITRMDFLSNPSEGINFVENAWSNVGEQIRKSMDDYGKRISKETSV